MNEVCWLRFDKGRVKNRGDKKRMKCKINSVDLFIFTVNVHCITSMIPFNSIIDNGIIDIYIYYVCVCVCVFLNIYIIFEDYIQIY